MAPQDFFSFLVTTDNHLGYKDDDHLRRKDSYLAFEEALEIARSRDVDFVLLGGDLFHVNSPSTNIEHQCIKVIRQHMNAQINRQVSFRRVAGEFYHFPRLNHANFEDQNLKVPIPIMTIHGNHDDPTGRNAQSVCEKLATCGLLNYFGAIPASLKDIVVKPIIFEKGKIKLALYGMGFIPDHKLKIAFDKGLVTFVEPPEDTFNILVVHQNRVPFLAHKCIPDDLFPPFFHLIIRGHEHSTESPQPLPGSKVGGLVYQPGSTVATSISLMESAPKQVGIFTVRINNPFGDRSTIYVANHELVALKNCRKIILKDISQKDIFRYIKKSAGSNRVVANEFKRMSMEYVVDCIRELLKEHKSSRLAPAGAQSGASDVSIDIEAEPDVPTKMEVEPDESTTFDLPLLRLRLEYASKSERFDELNISSQFYPNEVANKDIILFKKRKLSTTGDGDSKNITFDNEELDDDDDEEFEQINLDEGKRDVIDVIIENYFKNKPPEMGLVALSLTEYTNAVRGSNEDGNVISQVLNEKKQSVLNRFKDSLVDEQVAATQFHDEDAVHNWFLSAFGKQIP